MAGDQRHSFFEASLAIPAWILAFISVFLLRVEVWRIFGLMVAAVAAVLILFACRSWHPREFAEPAALLPARYFTKATWIGLFASLLSGLAADLAYLAQPHATFGAAGWLWLLSIGLFATSLAFLRLPRSVASQQKPAHNWPNWEIAALAGIMLVGFVLRLWKLAEFPNNIYPDEITAGQISSASYLSGGLPPSIFSTVWGDIDLPGLWFFLVSISLKIFGTTLAAVRLPSALFGAATVLPFYGFLRTAWGRNVAIAGAAIMAFSAADVHYSRLGINNILTPFFWTLCFFFLMRALFFSRPTDWGLAGMSAGVSEYGFYATRLLPFLLLVFLAYLSIFHRQKIRRFAMGWGLVGVGYLIGFGPLLAHFLVHPGLYFHHGTSVLAWDHWPDTPSDFSRMCSVLWPNFVRSLLGLTTIPSQDIIYFAPFLLPIEAALLILGAGLLMRDWKHPAAFLMILSGLGVIIVGGTLVAGAPFLNHLTGAFPAFYAAVAIALGASTDLLSKELSLRWKMIAPATLAIVLMGLCALNVRFYFKDYYANPNLIVDSRYRSAQEGYEIQVALSRFLGSLGHNYSVRSIANRTVAYDSGMTKFLSGTEDYANVAQPTEDQLPRVESGKGIAFIFFPGSEEYLTAIQSRYPGGTTRVVNSRGGRQLFSAYLLPPN